MNDDGPAPSQRRLSAVQLVLSAAAFMASLDLLSVTIAFKSIGQNLEIHSTADLSWVLNGYAIIYASLLIPLARIADRVGRKRAFVVGVAVFTIASLGCAMSTTLWELVAMRMLQAAGVAASTPTSLGLLVNAFPADRRAHAVRMWSASVAVAAAAGPVIAGLLVHVSWRLGFLINVPIGVAIIVVAVRVVPDSRDANATHFPDLWGAALITVGVGAVALGLTQGPVWGWTSSGVVVALVVAIGAAVELARRSWNQPNPVIDRSLMAVRTLRWSSITMLAFAIAFAANLLLSLLSMQNVWGYSPIRAALGVSIGPILVPVFALVGGRLAKRWGPGRVASVGCVLLGVAIAVTQILVGRTPHYLAELLPGQIIGGIGVGLALPTIVASGTAELPANRSATGSAIITMARQIGSVLGVSVLVAWLGTSTKFESYSRGLLHARVTCIIACVAAAVAAPHMTRRPAEPAPRLGVLEVEGT